MFMAGASNISTQATIISALTIQCLNMWEYFSLQVNQCIVNNFVDLPEHTPERVQTDSLCNATSQNLNVDASDRHLIGFSKNPNGVLTVANGYYSLSCLDGMKGGDHALIKYWGFEKQPTNSPRQQQFKYNPGTQQIQLVKTNRCVEMTTGKS
jgi:hypothetical protein